MQFAALFIAYLQPCEAKCFPILRRFFSHPKSPLDIASESAAQYYTDQNSWSDFSKMWGIKYDWLEAVSEINEQVIPLIRIDTLDPAMDPIISAIERRNQQSQKEDLKLKLSSRGYGERFYLSSPDHDYRWQAYALFWSGPLEEFLARGVCVYFELRLRKEVGFDAPLDTKTWQRKWEDPEFLQRTAAAHIQSTEEVLRDLLRDEIDKRPYASGIYQRLGLVTVKKLSTIMKSDAYIRYQNLLRAAISQHLSKKLTFIKSLSAFELYERTGKLDEALTRFEKIVRELDPDFRLGLDGRFDRGARR